MSSAASVRRQLPLLLCSIGNPGTAYRYTRHNAGHILLEFYREALRMPTLVGDGAIDGKLAVRDELYLYQSGTYMNTSGTAVKSIYKRFVRDHPGGRLCVLHDELETAHGIVKLRHLGAGKGHNGIRSCIKHMGTEDFARLAIGIGRPASRESAIVSEWVLGNFTAQQMKILEKETLLDIFTAVDRLRAV